MVDVQERQRQRYMLLNVLYEANGGAPTLRVDIAPLRDQRGFTQRELWEAMEYAYAFVSSKVLMSAM